MKTATQLTQLLKRYAAFPNQIELLKQRLIGAESCPVPNDDWHRWKEEQAHKTGIPWDYPPPRELSSDPTFHEILDLCEEMEDLWFEIPGGVDFDRAQEEIIRRIMWSFPSLRKVLLSPDYVPALYDLLANESEDPQAHHAVRFVYELEAGPNVYLSGWPKFFLDQAFEVWDEEHKEAFVRWTSMPFFPRVFHSLALGPLVV